MTKEVKNKSYLPFPDLPVHDILNVQAQQIYLEEKRKIDKAKNASMNITIDDYLKNSGITVPRRERGSRGKRK